MPDLVFEESGLFPIRKFDINALIVDQSISCATAACMDKYIRKSNVPRPPKGSLPAKSIK
jgi:hypothetical protein